MRPPWSLRHIKGPRALLALSLGVLMPLVAGCPEDGNQDPTQTFEPPPGSPALLVSPNPVNFRDVLIYNDDEELVTLTLSNAGDASLYIARIVLDDDGSDEGGDSAFVMFPPDVELLPPGEEVFMDVLFNPAKPIPYEGVIRIDTNDETEPVVRIQLLGSGTRGTDADGDDVTVEEGDCDDGDITVYPDAPELCDAQDNDCEGDVDEGFDADGDGYTQCDVPEPDCNDDDATVNPGAPEICDAQDNDCDGVTDEGFDADGVGGADCVDNDGDGQSEDEGDCDDDNVVIYDGAPELCDGLDNDCDGIVDNDPDDDGDGTPDCQDNDGDGQAEFEGDCDDTNIDIYDGAPELCDELDNDCDGEVDEGTNLDTDGDGFTVCGGDCDDGNSDAFPGNTETCDGVDQDCNGVIDDGFDVDGDGYTLCGIPGTIPGDCADNDPAINPGADEICDSEDPAQALDNDCDGVTDEGFDADGSGGADCVDNDGDGQTEDEGDCDDTNPDIYDGAPELCNGIDDDCDTLIDEGFDADGIGGPDCQDNDGDGQTENEGDCNDANDDIYDGATELCDSVDNDCDTLIDEGFDGDGDGTPDCQDNDGDGQSEDDGDCDDTNPDVYDGATEVCDGADNDCDTTVDEGFDGDGDGTPDCTDDDGDGQSENDGDCDDANPDVYDGATEVCNGIDDDCDTLVDEGFDADGIGGPDCQDNDGDGQSEDDGDCNDADDDIYDGAPEICDGADSDCDGSVDEDGLSTWYDDDDGDGYGDDATAAQDCEAPAGTVSRGGDCDDTQSDVYPGAPEVCDGDDNDCDGQIDEDTDGDGDGTSDCSDDDGDGSSEDEGDCDDTDPGVGPDATEICDGDDEDCDGLIDEGFDVDGDGSPDCDESDDDGDGYSENDYDCDDTNPGVYPITVDGSYGGENGGADGSYLKPYRKVQVGLDQSEDCPNVWVRPGTYAESVTFPPWDVGLHSTDGAAATVINGASVSAPTLSIIGPGHETSVLEGLTLRGGRGLGIGGQTYGGGLYISGADPLVRDMIITANTVTGSGGGVALRNDAVVVFEGGRIEGNTASLTVNSYGGGGVHIDDAEATFIGVEIVGNSAITGGGVLIEDTGARVTTFTGGAISDNEAPRLDTGGGAFTGGIGGGLYVENASCAMDDVDVTGNYAGYSGGGLYYLVTGSTVVPMEIHGGLFELNVAGDAALTSTSPQGGGIYQRDGELQILDGTRFTRNETRGPGGGLYTRRNEGVRVVGAIFTENDALFGGGIYAFASDAEIRDSTFVGNTASQGGGAITSFTDGSMLIDGNTFTENEAGTGGAVALYGGADSVTDNSFTGNQASSQGGGILIAYNVVDGAIVGSDSLVRGNRFDSNVAGVGRTGLGGGIFVSESAPEIWGNWFGDNTADGDASAGGAIRVSQRDPDTLGGGDPPVNIATPDIHNNVVSDNRAWRGGGISIEKLSGGIVWNNTLTGNIGANASTTRGGAIFLGTNATTQIRNNILAFSEDGAGIHFNLDDQLAWSITPSLAYNTFYDNDDGDFSGVEFSLGSGAQTGQNPNFTTFSGDGNPKNDTLTLRTGSPCINSGDPASAYDDVGGTRNDRGAYGGPTPYVAP